MTVRSRIYDALLALDRFANGLTGGDPKETISLRAARSAAAGESFGCVLCTLLDFFDRDHCREVSERAKVSFANSVDRMIYSARVRPWHWIAGGVATLGSLVALINLIAWVIS